MAMATDPVFLDTNGWLAILNASDSLHARATMAWREINRQRKGLVLTDWIIAETGNGLARTAARAAFSRAVEIVMSSARVRVVHVDEDLLRRAMQLYAGRADKGWGLTDCASFEVMREMRVTDALTSDHHFEQAGFVSLLRAKGT
jgi:hypothetical protein